MVSRSWFMPMSTHSFDTSDFVRSWLLQRKYRDAHADLKSCHETAFAAFSKAFGIDLNTPPDNPERFPDDDGLHRLFLGVAHAYEMTRSPFSGYLQGTREISEMYQQYGDPLETAATSLRCLHLKMMMDLITRIWGVEESRKVTQTEAA